MEDTKQYKIELMPDYIKMTVWGPLSGQVMNAVTSDGLELSKEHKISKLLCDITKVDMASINMEVQAQGIGALWRSRSYQKMAFVVGNAELFETVGGAISSTHLSEKFRVFMSTDEATDWLKT